jgi:hypothetical protein
MCPVCIASVTWAVVGATSTGGIVAALVTTWLRAEDGTVESHPPQDAPTCACTVDEEEEA